MAGRRGARVEDAGRWVFNRLAAAYQSRPGYPEALVERLSGMPAPGGRAVDLGAGTGDLALPLAARGIRVAAVEPAREMLDVLERRARENGIALRVEQADALRAEGVGASRAEGVGALRAEGVGASRAEGVGASRAEGVGALRVEGVGALRADQRESASDESLLLIHAAAEATGLPTASFDLALVSDALHWLDPELAGAEIARLLAPGGALAIVEVELLQSPFLDALWPRLQASNPKSRPRALDLSGPRSQLFSLAAPGAAITAETFDREDVLSPSSAAAVVASLSFVGPALPPDTVASLTTWASGHARDHGATWRRRLHLRCARRK
jgi:ubiquinone/menaquinone biosynthesis C-methylase UbiE